MTYNEAYNKIIDAYFRDEIKPLLASFCFCGTLCNNSEEWFRSSSHRHNDYAGYLGIEFVKMENALTETIRKELGTQICRSDRSSKEYEDALFKGMSAALDVLKEIHIQRGEIIDKPVQFKKRRIKSA